MDGADLHIYDSLPNYGIKSFSKIEQEYINLRFSCIKPENFIVENVQQQRDNESCGVWAAVFAVTKALGQDLCTKRYSYDMKLMRTFC